ncbi:hypothetical protein ACLMJK_007100 [Lecanora helva]
MATEYKITITNNSGSQQNYLIFNEPPKINQRVQEDVWANVFVKKATPPRQTTVITISSLFSAVVGSADSKPGTGVSVSCGVPMPVELGTADPSGVLARKGTTYKMFAQDGAPQFRQEPTAAGGIINAFEIQTEPFSAGNAVEGNWLIGLGGDPTGTGLDGPAATFVPQPSKSYQIEPIKKYWVATGDFKKGSMIKVSSVSSEKIAIDFSTRSSRSATIVHAEDGSLNLQA